MILASVAVYLLVSGLWLVPGTHDNDWPLLMWLAHSDDLSALLIGHYPPAQLLLVRALHIDTIVAAKLLNIAATLLSSVFIYRIAPTHLWGLAAVAAFVLAPEVLLSGQSEFGDPLALCAYLAGVSLYMRQRHLFWAGACLALSGFFRAHFVHISLLTTVLFLNKRVALGWVAAMLPYVLVTGSLFSPVAHTFLGQVLFGYDALDFANTYNTKPFIFTEHWPLLLQLMRERIAVCPKRLLPLIVVTLLGVRDKRVLRLALIAAIYYLAVIGTSWSITTRLLMPFVALLIIASVLTLQRIPVAAPALVLFACLRVGLNNTAIPEQLHRAADRWDAATQLATELRAQGLRDPSEAFVIDWGRPPTDTRTHIAYYNFGFWNLLNPTYAAERPIPRTTDDLRARGVRFVVLSSQYTWRPRGDLIFTGARTTDAIYVLP